jgi:hypothetical protein
VRLETIKVGNATCTSVEALRRFLAALNDQPVQPVRGERHDEAIEAELTRRGY